MDFTDYWVYIRERSYEMESAWETDPMLTQFLTKGRHDVCLPSFNRKMTNFIIVGARNSLAERLESMARKAKSDVAVTDEKATWGGFVNIRLSDEELAQFDHVVAKTKPTLQDLLAPLVADGKIALSSKQGTFSATLTATVDGKIYSMSSFSSDLWEALALLAFKVTRYPKWYDMQQQAEKPSRG